MKTLPSYHKLCVIFGEELADGRYSRLARNADPSGELPVSMTGMHFPVPPHSGQ